MKDNLEYKSYPNGLWARFITKLIAAWVFAYYLSLILFSMLAEVLGNELFFLLIFVLIIALVTWFVVKDIPVGWNNTVTVDFKNEVFIILSSGAGRSKLEAATLDFDGNEIPFSSIEHYSTKHYESFLFSAYYLVKFYANGKERKIISFKNASEYTEFHAILKNKLKLRLK